MKNRALWGANKEQRLAYRWFPVGAMKIEHPEGLGVVYIAPFDSPKLVGQIQVVGYRGTAGKPEFNYRMRSREQAEKHVSEWFDGLTKTQQFRAEQREANSKPHTFKIGDIVYNSWGYDQTNVDFYQIVRTTSHFVYLRRIASESTPSEGCSPMSGQVAAIKDHFLENSPIEQHKATGEHVCFEFGSGSLWDGKPKYESWYA